MNKTIYVRDEDLPLWDRARELAGDKLSPVIIESLRRFVAEEESKPKGYERIVVEFNDAERQKRPCRKAFVGRWILEGESQFREQFDDVEVSVCIAETAKGSVVALVQDDEGNELSGRFVVFDSFDLAIETASSGFLRRAIIEALKERGVPIEELDI